MAVRPRSSVATLLLASMIVVVSAIDAASPADNIFLKNNLTGVATARNASYRTPLVYQKAFGTADIRGAVPVRTDSRFPIASNTKVYVAISLYQLQERGLVDLEKPVQAYLNATDFAAFGQPNTTTQWCPVVMGDSAQACQNITFIQLLSMSACLQDSDLQFFPYPGSLGLVFGRHFNMPLVCRPGTVFYYSNPAFMLGAYFVEKFSGMPFKDYLQKHIHGPLGQHSTYFDPFNGKFVYDPHRVDEYYQYFDATDPSKIVAQGVCSSEFDLGSASGAGGIVSTHDDEALLYFTLFNFTAASHGAPLFTKRQSLLDLVRPRTYISPYGTSLSSFFAQGLFVAARTQAQTVPTYIVYEGEIMCSHTSNVFRVATLDETGDVELTPAVMTQVWSAVRVAYVTTEQFAQAQRVRGSSFFSIFATFPTRSSLGAMAGELMSYYFS